MTQAVIAIRSGDQYRYVTVARNGEPEKMIPMITFMGRYRRLPVYVFRRGEWDVLDPATQSGKKSVRGVGTYMGDHGTFLGTSFSGDKEVYILDQEDPNTITHDGTLYRTDSAMVWNNREMRKEYSRLRSEYGI